MLSFFVLKYLKVWELNGRICFEYFGSYMEIGFLEGKLLRMDISEENV